MSIKKIAKKLSKIRDNTIDNDYISEEDRDDLLALVHDTLMDADPTLKDAPTSDNVVPYLPTAENDNTPLTSDQKFRLRLMEKTGTGSASIH